MQERNTARKCPKCGEFAVVASDDGSSKKDCRCTACGHEWVLDLKPRIPAEVWFIVDRLFGLVAQEKITMVDIAEVTNISRRNLYYRKEKLSQAAA